jgi:Glyoxalase/Bleomycin resistance protein/Dioxygenase superfamily.
MKASDWVVGPQHIGIPTKDVQKTVEFYQGLGFTVMHQPREDVYFLALKGTVIETYFSADAAGKPGAVDHIALEVKDIAPLFEKIKGDGYELFDKEIQELPDFFDHGVRYFMIVGPNGEKIEFAEVL